MADVFLKFILAAAFFHGSYVYAGVYTDTEPDAARECSGQSIMLDQIGLLPDFYSGFESHVLQSRRTVASGDENSCKVVSDVKEITGDSVLVDVSDSSQAADFGLNDVIGVPMHELKTKAFLRGRNLVLLDQAFRYYELIEECRLLKTLGFSKISVLAGGIGSLSGSPPTVGRIGAADFHALRQKWRWLVFDLAGSGYASASGNLVNLGTKINKQLFSSKVGQAIEDFRAVNGFYPYALILDRQGRDYPFVLGSIAEKYRSRVFYLDGGIAGYQDFVLQQNTILEQKKHIESRGSLPCGSLN